MNKYIAGILAILVITIANNVSLMAQTKELSEDAKTIQHLKLMLNYERVQRERVEDILDKMIMDGRQGIIESGVKIPNDMYNWEMFTYVVRELKKQITSTK